MAHIISASRRTDIPAFYTEWLRNRLNAGYCTVVNPFNHKISLVSLRPEDVSCLVFWTKNPTSMLRDRELFSMLEKNYSFYFLFTINGYPEEFERGVCNKKEDIIRTFIELSERVESLRVIWRYDPIIISTITDFEYHRKNFSQIAERLAGKTRRVVVSVVDIYKTVARRFKKLHDEQNIVVKAKKELASCPDFFKLMDFFRKKATDSGIKIQKCCESLPLEQVGINAGKCIDEELINMIIQMKEPVKKTHIPGISPVIYRKDQGQRDDCLCTLSREIGAAHTCGHKCVYCYASPGDLDFSKTDRRIIVINRRESRHEGSEFHDPSSPSLFGWFEAE